MKLTTVLYLIVAVTGLLSWSIVGKYRKAWGAESGVTYICKRLIAEKRPEGWTLVVSQLVTTAAVFWLLYLINTK